MIHGKRKALTFSYDDGITQDRRLIKLLNKYDLKATFNLNFQLLGTGGSLFLHGVTVPHVKMRVDEAIQVYEGHEIAGHSLTHPSLCALPDEEVIRQVEEDRKFLSDMAGCEVVGMAYPGGHYDDRVVRLIREHTGMRYARTVENTDSFAPQTDLLRLKSTAHHLQFDRIESLFDQFLAADDSEDRIFYIWGHAYEFDMHDDWDRFENLLQRLSGHDEIFYGTNKEVLLGM